MYDASLYTVDSQLQELVAYLDAIEFFKDSILIVTSDHGESFHGPDRVGHKAQMNVEVLRIPLILVGHDIPVGVARSAAGLVDVVPTILDLVGVEKPARVDGRSLLSLLPGASGEQAPREAQRAHFSETDYGKILRSVARGSRHLIWDVVSGEQKYYDLSKDPKEQESIPIDEKGHELERELRDHVESLVRLRQRHRKGQMAPGDFTAPQAELSEAEEERLRALGYLE